MSVGLRHRATTNKQHRIERGSEVGVVIQKGRHLYPIYETCAHFVCGALNVYTKERASPQQTVAAIFYHASHQCRSHDHSYQASAYL